MTEASPASSPRRRVDDRPPTLSVISPTFNESANVPLLIDALREALVEVPHEIIIVDDDSPDRTWEVAEQHAGDARDVVVIRRIGEAGLSTAVIAGMAVARGEVLAVIDADMQHDERALPEMTRKILSGEADLVVGSRAAEGGSYGEWSSARRFVSWVATMIAKLFLRVPVTDPMSGFFAISRATYREVSPKINPQGFKILLEFVGRGRDLRVAEVGYTFRNRIHGETKMSPSVIRSYLLAVFELRFGRRLKPQFILYCMVGASGFVVNIAVFTLLEAMHLGTIDVGMARPVRWSLIGGIAVSMLWNFALNNYFTFYERRFRRNRLVWGLAVFSLVSIVGVVIHVSVFEFLQATGWGSGALGNEPARILHEGVAFLLALVVNYFLNVNYTWQRRPEI